MFWRKVRNRTKRKRTHLRQRLVPLLLRLPLPRSNPLNSPRQILLPLYEPLGSVADSEEDNDGELHQLVVPRERGLLVVEGAGGGEEAGVGGAGGDGQELGQGTEEEEEDVGELHHEHLGRLAELGDGGLVHGEGLERERGEEGGEGGAG